MDPLSRWDRDFIDEPTGTRLGPGWNTEDSIPYSYGYHNSEVTLGRGFRQRPRLGGALGSFWFDGSRGILDWFEVSGAFSYRAQVEVRDAADAGPPDLVTTPKFGGISIHGTSRTALNYAHLVLGGNGAGTPRCEWKSTDAIAGGSVDTSAFATVLAPNSTIRGQLRIDRDPANLQRLLMFTRYTEDDLLLDTGWTQIIEIRRDSNATPARLANGAGANLAVPLPTVCRLGIVTYSSTNPIGTLTVVERQRVRTLA